MRWRLALIIEAESFFGNKKQFKKLNKDKNDGDPAPKRKRNSLKKKSSRSDGASALFNGQTRSNNLLFQVFKYFMGNVFWPLLIVITGGIILSVILG